MKRCVPLEAAAKDVCNQSSIPPLIFQLPPEEGRRVLEEAQDTPVYKYPADISADCIDTGMWGSIPVYFIVPKGNEVKNIIFYILVRDGYLEATIHMKSWLGSFQQGQIPWLSFLNIAAHRKQNILQRWNSAILFYLI